MNTRDYLRTLIDSLNVDDVLDIQYINTTLPEGKNTYEVTSGMHKVTCGARTGRGKSGGNRYVMIKNAEGKEYKLATSNVEFLASIKHNDKEYTFSGANLKKNQETWAANIYKLLTPLLDTKETFYLRIASDKAEWNGTFQVMKVNKLQGRARQYAVTMRNMANLTSTPYIKTHNASLFITSFEVLTAAEYEQESSTSESVEKVA